MKQPTLCLAIFCITLPAYADEISDKAALVNGLYAALGGVLGIVLGAWGNHKLSISRDRRKEFNDISDPMRTALRKERERVTVRYSNLDGHDVTTLAEIIGGVKGKAFSESVARYREARGRWVVQDATGEASYSQTTHIEEAIDNLLSFLKRR